MDDWPEGENREEERVMKLEEREGGEWRTVGRGIAVRRNHSCVSLEGKLWVVGGSDATDDK